MAAQSSPGDPTTRLSNAAKQVRLVAERVETDGRLFELYNGIRNEMSVVARTGDGRPARSRQDRLGVLLGLVAMALLSGVAGFAIGYAIGVMG